MIDFEDIKSYWPVTNGKTLTKFLQDIIGNVIRVIVAVVVRRLISADIFSIYSDAAA
jgi:hypothetical protein